MSQEEIKEQHPYHPIKLALCFALGALLWFIPQPEGMSILGYHSLIVFVITILALVIKPLPLGAVALLSFLTAILTNTISTQKAFSAFQSQVVWLVVFALFIAKGFNVTGLGKRIAYFFTSILGKRTLTLSYGLMLSDLMLAPAIPSVTGRAAGIIFPILRAISSSYKSFPHCESAKKIGGFLTVTAFQVTVVTSSMFLTAMAANPLIAELVGSEGINFSWTMWAMGAIVPGICSLIAVPLFIYKIYPPEIKYTPDAEREAKQHLKDMGGLKRPEWIMLGTVLTLLILWINGQAWGINAVVAAMVGLAILLVAGVLDWKSLMKIDTAWETFFWFCILILLSGSLKEHGVLTWITQNFQHAFVDIKWQISFPILVLAYFYSHYLFASTTAHISSMFPAVLGLSILIGTPPMLAVLVLAYFSNLYGGLTHYSLAPAPLLYGVGYVNIKDWWRIGFLVSVLNIFIWSTVGLLWWKLIGLI